MSNRITIADVAAEAGVSMMTVSRVINQKDGVSDETTQRIWEVINRLGYRPSGVARSLAGCRAVLSEEVDRLERRKRFYMITDHIHNHDRKFVENEMRIQQALNAIDQLGEQIADIRERRMALSFVNGLVAPDQLLDPLTREQRAVCPRPQGPPAAAAGQLLMGALPFSGLSHRPSCGQGGRRGCTSSSCRTSGRASTRARS